jgi:hypothetical protein
MNALLPMPSCVPKPLPSRDSGSNYESAGQPTDFASLINRAVAQQPRDSESSKAVKSDARDKRFAGRKEAKPDVSSAPVQDGTAKPDRLPDANPVPLGADASSPLPPESGKASVWVNPVAKDTCTIAGGSSLAVTASSFLTDEASAGAKSDGSLTASAARQDQSPASAPTTDPNLTDPLKSAAVRALAAVQHAGDVKALPRGAAAPGDTVQDENADATALPAAAIAAPGDHTAGPSQATMAISAQQTALIPPSNAAGMSAALQVETMQSTQEVNEDSAQAGQKLPVVPAAFAASQPAGQEHKAGSTVAESAGPAPTAPAAAISPLNAHQAGSQPTISADSSETPATASNPLHRSIENLVVGMQRQDAGSMSVVLAPDRNTQLSLHVQMQHGQLEARAVLERGDFAALKSEWSQLQSRLASHGVRLAPLTSGSGGTASSPGGNPSSHRQDREASPSMASSAAIPGKNQPRRPGARTLPTNGREWWA